MHWWSAKCDVSCDNTHVKKWFEAIKRSNPPLHPRVSPWSPRLDILGSTEASWQCHRSFGLGWGAATRNRLFWRNLQHSHFSTALPVVWLAVDLFYLCLLRSSQCKASPLICYNRGLKVRRTSNQLAPTGLRLLSRREQAFSKPSCLRAKEPSGEFQERLGWQRNVADATRCEQNLSQSLYTQHAMHAPAGAHLSNLSNHSCPTSKNLATSQASNHFTLRSRCAWADAHRAIPVPLRPAQPAGLAWLIRNGWLEDLEDMGKHQKASYHDPWPAGLLATGLLHVDRASCRLGGVWTPSQESTLPHQLRSCIPELHPVPPDVSWMIRFRFEVTC